MKADQSPGPDNDQNRVCVTCGIQFAHSPRSAWVFVIGPQVWVCSDNCAAPTRTMPASPDWLDSLDRLESLKRTR